MHRFLTMACRQCSAPILGGYDSERCGLWAEVDILAIDQAGELLAIMSDRHTYAIRHGELDRRDHWMIRGSPAGARGVLVVPQHRCGQAIPGKPLPRRVIAAVEEFLEPPF